MDSSTLRQQIYYLKSDETQLLNILLGHKKMIKGTVYVLERRCGKKNCKCRRENKLHKSWVISWTENRKKHLRTIKGKDMERVKALNNNYLIFRGAKIKLMKLQKEIITKVNEIEGGLLTK